MKVKLKKSKAVRVRDAEFDDDRNVHAYCQEEQLCNSILAKQAE